MTFEDGNEVREIILEPHQRIRILSWDQVYKLIHKTMPRTIRGARLYGVPRGGWPIAQNIVSQFGGTLVDDPKDADFIVDDLIDSGATRDRYTAAYPNASFWAPIDKTDPKSEFRGNWISFPWEDAEGQTDDELVAARLLQTLGVDVASDGLRETPGRLLRSLRELTDGYGANPAEILQTRFEAEYDEMVIVKDIGFWSLCEHHVLPFHGTVTLAYLPKGKVVGLSKLARLVKAFSRRLQIQERFTAQLTEAMDKELEPLGSACLVKASHLCMAMRGIQTPAEMITSSLTGKFREATVRAEFLSLASSS